MYKYTDTDLFELIIVNNGSTDVTKEYLDSLNKLYNNIKIIHNEKNLGYAKGNNQGLKIAQGEYIFLCNNDLLFSPNWLNNAIDIFNRDKSIGLLSFMTNFCGNPNQVVKNADSCTKENYLEIFASQNNANDIIYQDKVIFFCVGMTREVFDKVGFLDENFGLAWYEDDDYTLRVLYQGYKPTIATNIFIYHNHSQTSSKLIETEEGKLLYEKNRQYYENKHAFYIGLKKQNSELKKQLKKKWYQSIFSITNQYIDNKNGNYI